MLSDVIIDSSRKHHKAFLPVAYLLLFCSIASGASFDGYVYPTPTPTPSTFDGYDYTTPSCPLLDQPPAPSCTASATILTVPVRINVTETIVTFIKQPTTVTSTLIVPTTTTEVRRAVETQTSYRTTTHTQSVTLPPVTHTSPVTTTIARLETVTSPVVRVEYVTERYPLVEYRTDTVTRTSTCTVTELFPTTYYSTYISTSYAPPVTDVTYLTETSYRTLTSTQLSTQIRTQTETTSVYRTSTETIRATRTLTETATVTKSCAPPPPPLNNEYLPVPGPSNDYLPPFGQQQAEQRLRSNFVLPEDLLPPKEPPRKKTVSVTVTKTLDPITLTKEHTVTKDAAVAATSALGGSGAAVRTKSVIAFDQRVTKLVTVTPTLTSYVYMDTVTVTSARPGVATQKAG
uniref:Uncharacterized protein n=1 Tax=Anopheles melas TaxID=34690 RepID=A0A182UKW5_9DIPT